MTVSRRTDARGAYGVGAIAASAIGMLNGSHQMISHVYRTPAGTAKVNRWAPLLPADATHFPASLSDAKGDVQAETDGTRFHLRYLLRHPAVYMEQS